MTSIVTIIAAVNLAITSFISLIADPLSRVANEALSLCLLSALIGILLTFAYGKLVNKNSLTKVKRKISANIFEAVLFRNDPLITLKAQGSLFINAFRYLSVTVVPIALLFIPSILFLSSLNTYFGSPGIESTQHGTLTIKTEHNTDPMQLQVVTDNGGVSFRNANEHLLLKTLQNIPQQPLTLLLANKATGDSFDISDVVASRQPTFQSNNFLDAFIWGAQKYPPKGIKEIRFDHAVKNYSVFGIELSWLTWSIIFIFVGGIAAVKLFNVPL